MRAVIAALATVVIFGGTALAQQTGGQSPGAPAVQSPGSGTSNPAVDVKPAGSPETTGAVAPGANSFTEGQARSRIEEQGFTNLSGLIKDEQGIWRGKAMQNGRSVEVMLDYRGNVTTR